jgi:predicted house-cleaning noncanonical NTP pyrophosphatase (MazG superfamily)
MSYRIVTSVEELVGFLCKKLDEELEEYKLATTPQEKTEEAGDVLEVLDTLIELHPRHAMHIHMKQYFVQQCVSDLLDMDIVLA